MAFDRRIWQLTVQQKSRKNPVFTLLPPSSFLLMLPSTTPNLKPQNEIVQFGGHRMEYGSVESSSTLSPVLLITVYEDNGQHQLFVIYRYMGNLGKCHYYFILWLHDFIILIEIPQFHGGMRWLPADTCQHRVSRTMVLKFTKFLKYMSFIHFWHIR